MHIEHSVPPPQAPQAPLHQGPGSPLSPEALARARTLLSELRHLLENSAGLSTALDVVDELDAALLALGTPDSQASGRPEQIESLNLVQLLNQALDKAAGMIARSNVVVLKRKSARRMVRARISELSALLEEVVEVAVRCCASASGTRILRARIHNDHQGFARLIVEHATDATAPVEPILRHAEGVEVSQDYGRCTITLTFLSRF